MVTLKIPYMSKMYHAVLLPHPLMLSGYLEDHGLLHNPQELNYHCGRSTDQIHLSVTDIVTCALDKGFTDCAVFLDLRKACDSFDHTILLCT